MIVIRNDLLQANIQPKGAELVQLRHSNGIEYLWNGDPVFWAKHSPVLFPIVGSLVQNSYRYANQMYTLPRHGFAREMDFEVVSHTDTEATFALSATQATLRNYPFHFRLTLQYRLEAESLSLAYTVENEGSTPLYFSIGGHPAFTLPLTPETEYTDYYLDFGSAFRLKRWKLEDGLVSNRTEDIALTNGRLPLHPALFYEDAIVLRDIPFDTVQLGCTKHRHGLKFHCAGFRDFGIWAARDAPFVCLEPWCGHADMIDHSQQLEQKEGIMVLQPGEAWQRAWSVTCF